MPVVRRIRDGESYQITTPDGYLVEIEIKRRADRHFEMIFLCDGCKVRHTKALSPVPRIRHAPKPVPQRNVPDPRILFARGLHRRLQEKRTA